MIMYKTTNTGDAVNLNRSTMLEIVDTVNSGKVEVWSVGDRDIMLADFDTREQAEEFVENLVAQLNAPMNFPAQMQSMTKDFLDKVAKDKALVKDDVPPKTFKDFLKLFTDSLVNSTVEALGMFDLKVITSDLDKSEKIFLRHLSNQFADFADDFIRIAAKFVESGEKLTKENSDSFTQKFFLKHCKKYLEENETDDQ